MGYLDFETKSKALTRGDDIGKGQLDLKHLGPSLFLQLQMVQLHTHRGAESQLLSAESTPEMVRAYRPTEREEHGVATWTGGASNTGSLSLTFGTAFTEVPDVFCSIQDGTANILVQTGVPTATGVTFYWKDTTGATHTSLPICWIAKGRQMSAIDSKYHLKIGDFGFLLARQIRTDRHVYTREESPHFVNKFSSGDPNYRDATFFPHWAILNWQNGFNQEFFDDGGKFYRSTAVDPTDQSKLVLQKAFNSAGQVIAGATINCAVALIQSSASVGWANTNYGYRKQLTITAPAGKTLPIGLPIKVTEDTAVLETAVKVRSDRKDWRVFYFNGSTWVDLTRDYIGTTETWFALQAAVAPAGVDTSYYIYYSYSTESTTKQPSTAADWNAVYTPGNDSDTKGLWHFKENTGVTVADTSGNAHDITLTGGTWGAGKYGDGILLNGSTEYGTITDHADLKPTGSFVIEGFIKGSDANGGIFQSRSQASNEAGFLLALVLGKVRFQSGKNTGVIQGTDFQYVESTTSVDDNVLHHIAGVWDGSNLKVYVDGVSEGSVGWNQAPAYAATNYVQIGCQNNSGTKLDFWNGTIDAVRLSSVNRTSFAHGLVTTTISATAGSEVAKAAAPSASAYKVLAGASNGKIYSWDGGTTWTQVKDTTNTSVNCAILYTNGGTQYAYFGSGGLDVLTDSTAKVHRTSDGTTFNDYTVSTTAGASAQTTALGVFSGNLYAGVGPMAQVFKSTDGTTWTLSKDIDDPKNPGFIWCMEVYNSKLYVGGGHPQKFRSGNSAGFLWSYDDFEWKLVFPFDFTVIKSLKVYDSLLFVGTISKRLYVFNTANVDKILEFPWAVSINGMETWQDKLAIALGPTDPNNLTGQEAVYLFDRNGFHDAFDTTNATIFTGLLSVGNELLALTGTTGYVYTTASSAYQLTGNLQSSYYEAQLPNIYKLYRSFTLMYDALPTGCTIAVDYKTDEADASWTSLGTASTVGSTSAVFNFASGIYSYKISIRITLTTTNNSLTPTLRKTLMKYVLSPDFKYMWKMKLLAVDDIVWQDGTEPKGILNAAVTAGATSITLKSSDIAIPTSGFPNPSGSTAYAIIETSAGVKDMFSYTGKTNTTLTGIPATGTYALGAHAAAEIVRVTGAAIHQVLLDLKGTRQLFTFTDIDGLTYTVLFHAYQEDNFVVNQDNYRGGFENEVPITLLEA